MSSAYPEYRESGVNWVENIPAEWKVAKTAYFFEIAMGQTILKENLVEGGRYPVFSATAEDHYFGRIDNPRVKLDVGDLVIPARGNSIGAVKIVYEIATTTQTTIYCKKRSPDQIDSKYAFHFMKGSKANLFRFTQTAIPQITTAEVGNNPLIIPPLEEQKQIAKFLDYETAKIDALIEKQEQLIALLKEKRQAVISHAVTKGLNPDAPMRDSGVEWLGEVPAHWEVMPMKHLFEFVTSGSRGWAEYYADDGPLFFRITNLTRDTIESKLLDVQNVKPPDSEGERSRIKEGDILISITADLGSVCVASREVAGGYVSQHVALCRPNRRVAVPRWLGFFVLSNVAKVQFMGSGYGGTKIQLSLQDVREVLVAVPNAGEQIDISDFIDNAIAKFSQLLVASENQVVLLKERRTALISAAVTGKIDVREWKHPEEKEKETR